LTAKLFYFSLTYREGIEVELTSGYVLQSRCVRNSLSQLYFLQLHIEVGKCKKKCKLFSRLIIQSIFYLQMLRLSKKDSSGNEKILENMKYHNI